MNAVSPTVVDTEMSRIYWGEPARKEWMLSRIPQEKFAEIDDVVNPVMFLLSDSSDMINGSLVAVDGGFLAC